MLIRFVNFLLGLAGIFNIGFGTYFMVQESVASGGAAITAGLVLFLIATVDRFESLKGLGIEAKTRELTVKLDEADKILAQMQKLAAVTGQALISLSSKAGRFDTTSSKDAYALSRSVRDILSDSGLNLREINNALVPWAKISAWDLTHKIMIDFAPSLKGIQSKLLGSSQNQMDTDENCMSFALQHQQLTRYITFFENAWDWDLEDFSSNYYYLRDKFPSFIPKADFELFFKKLDIWAPEVEYLAKHMDFKNPEMWLEMLD